MIYSNYNDKIKRIKTEEKEVKMEEKELFKIKKILKKYIGNNDINFAILSEVTGVKKSTIKTYLSVNKLVPKKFIEKFLNLKKIDKEDRIFLEKFSKNNKEISTLILKRDNKNKKVNYNNKDIEAMLDELKVGLNELKDIKILVNEFIKLNKNDAKHDFKQNINENKKMLSLQNDYETINRAIKTMWLLNDESNKYFSELNFLLSTNSMESNLKLKKGILEISKNLIEMGEKLKKYIKIDTEIIEIQ